MKEKVVSRGIKCPVTLKEEGRGKEGSGDINKPTSQKIVL